uniref:Uncharacterized protein n=1 Tax=Globodera rostochiensis TaxID=31243 RepID=A0A914HYQ6_GLORO
MFAKIFIESTTHIDREHACANIEFVHILKKGNVAKPGGAEPRGLLFVLGGQKTGANGIGKQNEQPKPPSKSMKVRGGRRKRDVLGNAGGDVGGWDHPIDST